MKVPPAVQQGELLINHPRFEDQRFVCEIFKIGNSVLTAGIALPAYICCLFLLLYPQLLFLPAKVLVISERICRAARNRAPWRLSCKLAEK